MLSFTIFGPMCCRLKLLLWCMLCFHSEGLKGQSVQKVLDLSESRSFKNSGGVAEINADSDNNLWIIMFGNIQRYNGREHTYISGYGVNNSIFLRFYEKGNGAKLVIDKLNQLFYIEGDTLRASEMNDTLRELSKGQFCSDFYFDSSDRLHIAFPGREYLIVDSNLHISYPLRDQKLNGLVCMLRPDGGPPFTMKIIDYEDLEGEKFFYVLNEEGKVLNKHPIESFMRLYPNSITQLKNGNYLVSSGNGDLFEFNEKGFIKSVPCEGIPIRVHTDKLEGLWISTDKGIDYYREGEIDTAKREYVLENTFSIPTRGDFQGGLWIGGQNGIHYIQFPLHSTFSNENGLLKSEVNALGVIDGKLYYGETGEALYTLDLEKLASERISMPFGEEMLASMKYDSVSKRTWVSQPGKLFYSDGDGWHRHSISIDAGMNRYYLDDVEVVHDSITIAGRIRNRFFYGTDTLLTLSEPFDQDIISLLVLGDSVFVGTNDGLFLEVKGKRIALFEQFPLLKGIVKHVVYFDKRIWFSINGKGLYILEEDRLLQVMNNTNIIRKAVLTLEGQSHLWATNDYGSYMFSRVDTSMEGKAYSVQMFETIPATVALLGYTTNTSMYWKLSSKEVLKVDYDDLRKYPCRAPVLAITGFRVNDKSIPISDKEYQFKHDENFVYFDYSAASYSDNRLDYRYRVEGLKDSWTITKEKKLQFLGLPPGEYTLELQAQVVHQVWSDPVVLTFKILAPYWKRTWFIAMEVILTLLLLYALVSYRLRMADKQKELLIERLMADQKALKAQLNPHFIFNAINSVQYFIRAKKNEEAEIYVGLFADLARQVLENSEKKLVSFTQEMHLYSSQVRLQSMVLPNKESIDLVFDVDQVNPDLIYMPPALLQPYIENAMWHGLRRKKGEKRITINVHIEKNMVVLRVRDNGLGREAANQMKPTGKAVKSFGMNISAQRIDVMNELIGTKSVVEIEDLKNEQGEVMGTEIILKIPHIESDEIPNS